MPRPSSYTDEIVQEICDRLSEGEPLAVICRDAHMPGDSTVYEWAKARPDLSRHIARARETGFDTIAWRTRATAEGKGPDEGGRSTGDVNRDKLIVDTDLKLLAKWSNRYSDSMQLRHANADGGSLPAPVPTIKIIRVSAPQVADMRNVTPIENGDDE